METGRLNSLPQPKPAAASSNSAGERNTAAAAPAPTAPSTAVATRQPNPTALAKESQQLEQNAQTSRASVEKLVERISKQIQIDQRSLSFQVNNDIGKTIVTVVDTRTDKVIRQIPSEEVVRLAQAIQDIVDQRTSDSGNVSGPGLLLQDKA